MALSVGGWHYYQALPPDKIIVLVANFKSLRSQNYGVSETIIEQLEKVTESYDDVKIKALDKEITAQQGSEIARIEGNRHKASIVLWGWYVPTETNVQVTAHFDVLHKPRSLALRQDNQTLNAAVGELKKFNIHTKLSSDMSYLTLLTLGLTRYEAEDYDGAVSRFKIALTQKSSSDALKEIKSEEIADRSAIHFYLGTSYIYRGEL